MAAIDGHALGGGLMLAVAQDVRIASDRARFGLPEVTLGFNPAYGIARLLDIAGGGHARDLLLTGRTVHASEALRMGLVNRVVAPPTLEASAGAWAAEIAAARRPGGDEGDRAQPAGGPAGRRAGGLRGGAAHQPASARADSGLRGAQGPEIA
jgi:enoyl-CoA hydratase/carnithine racemase